MPPPLTYAIVVRRRETFLGHSAHNTSARLPYRHASHGRKERAVSEQALTAQQAYCEQCAHETTWTRIPGVEKPMMIWECARCGNSCVMDWRVTSWRTVYCRVCQRETEGAHVQHAQSTPSRWVCWTCGWLFSTAEAYCNVCKRKTEGVRVRRALSLQWVCLTCGTKRLVFSFFGSGSEAVGTVATLKKG